MYGFYLFVMFYLILLSILKDEYFWLPINYRSSLYVCTAEFCHYNSLLFIFYDNSIYVQLHCIITTYVFIEEFNLFIQATDKADSHSDAVMCLSWNKLVR